jgi:hypothetical protein
VTNVKFVMARVVPNMRCDCSNCSIHRPHTVYETCDDDINSSERRSSDSIHPPSIPPTPTFIPRIPHISIELPYVPMLIDKIIIMVMGIYLSIGIGYLIFTTIKQL